MLNLFRPGKIGNLQIKNRIMMGPMGITGLLEPDGRYSQRGIDFYVRRAAGGAGLIISGVVLVDSEIEKRLENIAYQVMWDNDFNPIISLKVLAESRFNEALNKGYSFYRYIETEGVAI